MQGKEKRRKKKAPSPRGGAAKKPFRYYPFEVRLKAAKLHLNEGIAAKDVAKEIGVSRETVHIWSKRYRKDGEEGLKTKTRESAGSKTPAAVKKKIAEIKKEDPTRGKKRISQILKRIFFIKASPETVQKTLKEKGLVQKPKKKKKPKKNPARPRFFERARPNQMWQSDIFTFRLGGRNAYLIGFLDDYSRYIAGMELYRSMTAERLLEVYRRAIGEYNVPREVLTDNGRQYTNWRGTTRFEKELKKDNIKHIRSAPHHPMTLGKIERFWKTIFAEFLVRAQFESFENAQERVKLWIKYYNHRRPHQGIGGLCPADRFFEIQNELKKLMQAGIEENVLELALRGKPKDPFYMVGRMGGQSVVIQAEKGKVRMRVDGEEETKEMEYPLEKKETADEESKETVQDVQRDGEGQGSVIGMGGEEEAVGGVQGTGDQVGESESLAEPGAGGYAEGPRGPQRQGQEERSGDRQPAAETSGKEHEPARENAGEAGQATGHDPAEAGQPEGAALRAEEVASEEAHDRERTEGEAPGGGDTEGPLGPDHGHTGSPDAGGIPENLLRVGEAWPGPDDGGPHGEAIGEKAAEGGHGEGEPESGERGTEEAALAASHQGPDPRGPGGGHHEPLRVDI